MQKPSPVNNYGDWGDGEAIAGSVAIWWRGGRGVVSVGVNLSPNLEASRERFATCRCRSHGNREVLSFRFVSIGRTESRPSLWRRWGAFFAQTATIFDGNTARIVTKKNPKLGTRSGLFAVCCLT